MNDRLTAAERAFQLAKSGQFPSIESIREQLACEGYGSPPTRTWDGKAVVLIVEDEALIRMNIVQVVGDSGFEVLEAANANEAIEILESRRDIRAVFTDIVMGGWMEGLKLARIIRDRWPPIQLIVSSGRDVSDTPEFPLHSLFIPKPYANSQITAALREVLTFE